MFNYVCLYKYYVCLGISEINGNNNTGEYARGIKASF